MTTQAELDVEFKAWRQKQGLTGVQKEGEVEEFLAERTEIVSQPAECARWQSDHPDIIIGREPNKSKLEKWLRLHDYRATYANLDEAYAALKPVLEHVKVAAPLPEVETRPGRWRNGIFIPDPNYLPNAATTYAQHADAPATVGQSDPGRVAAGEPTIRKSVKNMSAQEYLDYINSSRSFQRKMDESK